ncbi:hypothetical protein M8J76_004839 [Diaphorina citri]|nr:hypothetical protein M8J76_004839 [Diaphorina citri]
MIWELCDRVMVACFANFQPSQSQGFQPIVHYVLTPVEIFRIPRPDYQPQIQVLPTEDLGNLVVSNPTNDYFRNLLINTVSYDSVDVPRDVPIPRPTPVLNQPAPLPCPQTTPTTQTPVPIPDDVDIINNTITEANEATNKTSSEMIARIIDDTMDLGNGTDVDDDDGSVEATTPRLGGEGKLNQTERLVTRRFPASATPPGDSTPMKDQTVRGPRHLRPHGIGYGTRSYRKPAQVTRHRDLDNSFEDDEDDDDYTVNSSFTESDSYEDEDDPDDDNNDHGLHDEHGNHHDNHHYDDKAHHDNHPHDDKPIQNDRFLDDHEIRDDIGDDLFRFDHKNTDHKVLNYQRADRKVRPHA